MTMVTIEVCKLAHYDESLPLPSYETLMAAGADIRVHLPDRGEVVLKPKTQMALPTAICVAIPQGFEIQVRPRSGLSLKRHLLVLNAPGTIDADYRGEIKIILGNWGDEDEVICHGDRVAQLVVAPVLRGNFFEVKALSQTARGEHGFGSTGVA